MSIDEIFRNRKQDDFKYGRKTERRINLLRSLLNEVLANNPDMNYVDALKEASEPVLKEISSKEHKARFCKAFLESYCRKTKEIYDGQGGSAVAYLMVTKKESKQKNTYMIATQKGFRSLEEVENIIKGSAKRKVA